MAKSAKQAKERARILIVVPTLGERIAFLRQTLESIASQAPTPVDIAMVYPLKNKEVAKLAKEFGAVSVEDPGGISASVNAGILTAKPPHEFIGWLGDDDLLAPESLKTAIAALDANPKAVVAYGYCDYIDTNGQKLFTNRAGSLAPWIMRWGPDLIPLPGAVFRRSAFDTVGLFNEENKYAMDLDMFLRLSKVGKFVNTKRVLASFRWHPTSTTVANRKASLKEAEQTKRKYLPRPLRPISFLWEKPVQLATIVAAKRVNAMARRQK